MSTARHKPIRSFLLITLDDLRGDRLGFAGYPRPTSPELDKLSEECLLFENAFSPGPATSVAFPAIMSSTYPLDFFKGSSPWLMEGRPYLLEALSQGGVRTGVIHSHPLLSESFGYARGVDVWVDIEPPKGKLLRKRAQRRTGLRERGRSIQPVLERLPLWDSLWRPTALWCYQQIDRLMMRFYHYSWETPGYAQADEMTDRTISVLETMSRQQGPFFLWVHYIEPHGPYFAPAECMDVCAIPCTEQMRKHVNRNYDRWVEDRKLDLTEVPVDVMSSLYDAELRFVDREVGRLLDYLRESSLWDSCALAVTADHGEEFGEHGGMFHHLKLYHELLHVPMMLRVPGREPRRVSTPVSSLDICPTVSDLLGIKRHPGWRGKSLLRFWDSKAPEEPGRVLSECRSKGSPHVAATGSGLRLICKAGKEWEAYRREDRLEAENVYDELQHDDELRALRALIERRLAEVESTGEDRPHVDDERLKERLRGLGYLQ